MTQQERSAAREALSRYWNGIGYPWSAGPRDAEIAAMHAVLTKHEADVRKRIAKEIRRECPGYPDALWVAENIVNPTEPVLCKTEWCKRQIVYRDGIENPHWVHFETNSEDCAFGYKAEPAEESTR